MRLYQDFLELGSQAGKGAHTGNVARMEKVPRIERPHTDNIANTVRFLLRSGWNRRQTRTRTPETSSASIINIHNPRKAALSRLTNCLPVYLQSVLEDALNIPVFYPGYEVIFPPTHDRSPFTYSPLNGNEVRVLDILPCLEAHSPIRCKLSHVDLDQKPEFVAFSYAWHSEGTARYEDPVAYIHSCTVLVVPSQARLLRILRARTEGSISAIWLDGLCVNQEDSQEAHQQIFQMSRIFAEAKEVIVGLGDEIHADAQVVAIMERLSGFSKHLPDGHSCSGGSEIMDHLHDLADELDRSEGLERCGSLLPRLVVGTTLGSARNRVGGERRGTRWLTQSQLWRQCRLLASSRADPYYSGRKNN